MGSRRNRKRIINLLNCFCLFKAEWKGVKTNKREVQDYSAFFLSQELPTRPGLILDLFVPRFEDMKGRGKVSEWTMARALENFWTFFWNPFFYCWRFKEETTDKVPSYLIRHKRPLPHSDQNLVHKTQFSHSNVYYYNSF